MKTKRRHRTPKYASAQWSKDQPPPPPPESDETETTEPRKRHRYFWWFFLAVQIIFIVWLIASGIDAGSSLPDCSGLTGQRLSDCRLERAAGEAGTGIGIGLVIALWVAVDFILGISYAIYRLAKRP